MGKSKGGVKGKAGSTSSNTKAPKCTCDHPYNCSCGNRPPRPSKGHKWDAELQQWGGKGHKQKGASGQSGAVAQAATTTSTGKTKIEQWQKLPSQILADYCKKQKRRPPKFKDMLEESTSKFKYRCIVPDTKDSDKDLFFVPAQPVTNEEQAKEEAALLALLHLTPTLPHERTLPEPYKTTWLNAVQSQKGNEKNDSGNKTKSKSQTKLSGDDDNNDKASAPIGTIKATGTNNSSNRNNNGAASSSSLTLGSSYVSNADKRKRQEEKRQQRNARIRKHEAIRMANRNHPVFLSARLRQQIQQLIRGDKNIILDDGDDDNDDDGIEPGTAGTSSTAMISDKQAYVEGRLHQEGFTKRQARTAYSQAASRTNPARGTVGNDENDDEDQWELVYEECLQWLCVHLEEDQLPEGFDPRGQTLEVVVPNPSTPKKVTPGISSASTAASGSTSTTIISQEAMNLADKYGLSDSDAVWLLSRSSKDVLDAAEDCLWISLCEIAGCKSLTQQPSPGDNIAKSSVEETNSIIKEEMEVLEAMFGEDCRTHLSEDGKFITFTISMPDDHLEVQIVISRGVYPNCLPKRVLVSGVSTNVINKHKVGATIHVELIKFMSTLTLGEPMLFEVYNHLQSLVQTVQDMSPTSLLGTSKDSTKIETKENPGSNPTTSSGETVIPHEKTTKHVADENENHARHSYKRIQRPRQRDSFWSTPPEKSPAAIAFPKISKSMLSARQSLPAVKSRREFLAALKEAELGSRVVLVTGDTGCGKSTQCCQFILEEAPDTSKIVVAQPRRLAATGVAGRVANERGENEAGTGSVGYVVRGQSAVCRNTRLLFCTTGVLLRQLQCQGALDCITHIMVDEVHERSLDSDVLLGLLKQILESTPHLRVVLMSATLDADRFAAYWNGTTPRVHIPGRTYKVDDFFLEDVLSLTNYIPPKKPKKNAQAFRSQYDKKKSSPWADSERSSDEEEDGNGEGDVEVASTMTDKSRKVETHHNIPIEELVQRLDSVTIDYDLLGRLVKYLVSGNVMGEDGSILVFLPGAPEINQAKTIIQKITQGMPIAILPLHGGLQPKEQNAVFQPSPNAVKVILSTNVAETSITIPDCTVVVDTCREKQSSYDPSNRMPLLVEQFASKASLKQRRGRAGRVREGVCYKLVSKNKYEKLLDHTLPEISRCALDQTLLSLLFIGVEKGSGTFLRTLLDPPSQVAVDAAIFSLSKMGALEGEQQSNEVRLTPLGMHLAGIPAPPIVGKMLVLGSILGCRRGALAMAAAISVGRSPFLRVDAPRSNKGSMRHGEPASLEELKKTRILEERAKLLKTCGNSDHAMLAAAFLQWLSLGVGGGERKRYCESLGISFTGMKDISQLANQLDSSLNAAGFRASDESDRNANSWRILRTCAVAAMAPGQLVRLVRPSVKYVDTAEGALEKDGEARELKFYIRQGDEPNLESPVSNCPPKRAEERVFIHPSSANFSVGNFGCPYLVYNGLVRTSKPFLRDVTECSAYALLLFGGSLEVQSRNDMIVIDNWVQLSANARIGALIRFLRDKMDDLLAKKIEEPSIDLSNSTEMKLIVKLLITDGLG